MQEFIIHTRNNNLSKNIADELNVKLLNYKTHFRFQTNQNIDLNLLREKYQVDINLIPKSFNPKNIKAFVSDMDSTLINIECIDEIADFAGFKEQVASITENAMRGEIDFNTSLTKRVALLKDLDTSVLQQVYDERLKINNGGEELIAFLQSKNIITAVVSGGFDFFTSRLKTKLGLDYDLSNKLEIKDNILTGNTYDKIINADEKANFVNKLPFDNSKIITCGDGANDLEMMQISGLSIAYHAKDVVNQQADIVIKFGGLDKIIDLFNY